MNDRIADETRARSVEADLAVVLAVILAFPLLLIASPPASARQETPPAVDCQIAPRSIDEIEQLAAGEPLPTASPPVRPAGDVANAITATIREAVACANANDPLRAFALFTDRYVAARFGPDHPDDLGSLRAAVSRQPVPATESDRLTIIEIGPVEPLADGRVQAIVITENSTTRFTDVITLAPAADRWLIDDWSPAPNSATPTA